MTRRPTARTACVALAAALAAVLAVVGPALARQDAPGIPPGPGPALDIAFRHLTTDQGLPSSVVMSLTQDALGFVWVGTQEGLVRFDGVDLREYRRTADTTSLPGNVVQELAPAPRGALWVGTADGLARYDPATDRFRRIDGLPSGDIRALAADDDGGVWVGSTAGLAFVDADGRLRREATRLPDPMVEALHLGPDGDLWIGTSDGLVHRAPDGATRTYRPDSLVALGAFRVATIAPSRSGLLVGTFGDGLLSLDPSTGAFTEIDLGPGIIDQNVSAVHEDAAGTIWAGTLGGGLHRLAPAAGQLRVYRSVPEDPGSLSSDEVAVLMEDRQGVLWVGTYAGLDRFDRARGTAARLRHTDDPASIASNAVRSLLVGSDGTLYVGTDRTLDRSTDGRRFRHDTIRSTDQPSLPIRALYEDAAGTVWVGTEGGGPLRVTPDGTEPVPFSSDRGVAVTSFLETEAGQFWVGTLSHGLARYERDTGETTWIRARAGGLPSDEVRALVEDASGALWVGTDVGLCRLDGGSAVTCLPTEGPADYVYALHARRDGSLYAGTKAGLLVVDTDGPAPQVRRYTVDTSDLPDDTVHAIVEDEGVLWLSTGAGLMRFEPLTGVFSRRPGTQDIERSLNSAATRAADGRLLFGSERGVLIFLPQTLLERNAIPPEIAITRVDVDGLTVDPATSEVLSAAATVAEEIRLGPDQAYLTIHYAGLHFSDPAQNTYRYRLLGLYDDWREVGTDREATFSALPPGNYTFEVEAANADGVGFDGARASIAVVALPPWWRTWWALVGFAMLGVLALVRADRWQRARLLRQERERADRREAELRAETAEAETAKATAEAAALKAENDRKAAELEQARKVEQANAKLAEANGQLEASLQHLRETQTQLVQSEKLASLGQLTAGIAHEIKNPLNFVNNFADLSVELAQELREEMGETPERPVGEVLAEVGDLLDDLQENARRIREHGQRADRIVRSMLLHSRGGSAERGRVDLARFVEEYVNLAFHGARANDSDFRVEIVHDFAPDTGEAEVVPQEFGRVLINLLTNAFHAVNARDNAEGTEYAPRVTVRTRRHGGEVSVEIEDNGTGIPADVKAKIFEPFFTTKPTGEGTGLGLSLAHDIVTSVHGGRMTVESAEGEGTTFAVAIPAAGEPMAA
ncbi:two-component regulator propeller domain-containing protein [Rubrivirga sp. IMCC43871]|uniref:two-component regulator propeller domain-containing protein n=1 Tax=Rubrivirga sp. IMCC43871 TaxID=3391575 RepID=UPI00398FBEFF